MNPYASYTSTNPEDNPRFGPVAQRGFEIDTKPFKMQRKAEKRKLKQQRKFDQFGSKAGKTFQVFNQNGLPQQIEEEENRFY